MIFVLYGICVCMFISRRICARFLYCMGIMLAYSIPRGYVHQLCVLTYLTIFG